MAHDDSTTDDMVAESALQLWSAAQTDFDPFEVPSEPASGLGQNHTVGRFTFATASSVD